MAKKISDIMLETRTNKGFNKSEMARQLGVVSQLYGQYESGEVEPKLKFRQKFEEIFGVSLINIEEKSSKQEIPRNSTDGNKKTSKKLNDNEKVTLDSFPRTKNGEAMTIERVLSIAERLAIATERDSVTKESLAKTIERLMDHLDGGLKRKAN